MTKEQIQSRVDALAPWYHSINLGDGIVTPGWFGIKAQWESVRKVRQQIDYAGKNVLDIGSRDGMWAFEAEELGASIVVATDIGFNERLLLAKVLRGSKVIPYQNCPAEKLTERLDCFRREHGGVKFDIIQHLGVLYHLPDQIRSLWECRKNIVDGGTLILETAILRKDDVPLGRFNSDGGVYSDAETFWALNEAALYGILNLVGFEVIDPGFYVPHSETIGRICLAAKATHEPFDYPY